MENISLLINNLSKICAEYRKSTVAKPFNIILLTSDLFYRENFHSEIIAAILANEKFKSALFRWLNEVSREEIDIDNYKQLEVVIEEGRIDILVKDTMSMHCIIYENKINYAGDMNRQIPRYIEKQKSEGYSIDGIIYISLDGQKRPDRNSWTIKDKQETERSNLIYVAASNGKHNDFVNGFLCKCIMENCSMEEFSYLRQYIDLLIYLGRTQMDMELMDKFYKQMKKSNNYKDALSIRLMLDDLKTYRRDRLFDYFKNKHLPFNSINKWSSHDTFFQGLNSYPKENIKLDLICEDEDTKVMISQNNKNIDSNIKELLTKLKVEDKFEEDNKYAWYRLFNFPDQEKQLYDFVDEIIRSLSLIE